MELDRRSHTSGKHTVEVLDGAEVDQESTGGCTQVCHFFGSSGHDRRRAQGNRRVGRLGCYDIVGDLGVKNVRSGPRKNCI